MYTKLVLAMLAVAACLASVHGGEQEYIDYSAPPRYKFEYSVEDPKTHDIKSQEEYRDGDQVKGYYKLLEPSGYYRIVNYVADKKSGFVADVTRTKSGYA